MTVSRGQKSTIGQQPSGSTVVTSWGTNPAAGSSVLVFVQTSVAPTSVVDNGTSPTTYTLDAGGGSTAGAYVYRANGITLPSSGAYHVTVTISGSHTIQALGIEYLGMKSGSPDANNTSLGVTGTSVTTGSAGPAAAGGVVFGGFSDNSGLNPETITFTGSAPQTSQQVVTNGSSFWPMGVADALTGSAQAFTWTLGDSVSHDGAVAAYSPAGGTAHPGTAALSGSGTLTGAGIFAGTAALSGAGTLTGTATHLTSHGHGTAALSGVGSLAALPTATLIQVAALDGQGTLNATWIGVLQQPPAAMDGQGTLQLSGVILQFPAALSGNGTLSVLQATGGLVFASPGAAVPYAYPLSSQVMVAPPGTQAWTPLGSAGAVTALSYSYACPGGADKMTATVMVPASFRSQLFNPGWQVKITRGGHQVWSGKLDEPQPSPAGWTLTAVGAGNRGQDFTAIYTSKWPNSEPDEPVNAAISRGLPWINPGIGTPSGAWYGQAPDSGAQTITGLLNLICTRGGLTWMVNSQPGGLPGDDLSVFPLPTAVNRLLVCTQPTARTLGGDINTIYLRYQSSADDTTTGATAAYATTSAANAASVAAHGVIETYIDLSSAGVMSAGAAQAVGNSVLAIYQRASFAGPFTARYGQLTTTGGVPVDPGTDQAGTVVKLILVDFGFGGEVSPNLPVTFITGAYEWDDLAQTATITPYVNADQSLTGMLSTAGTVLTPITVA